MEVGSEISRKIQAAIKAKLMEINAYVDDELPDYIMIMVANRKPEDQMSDALNLFLGDHTKVFTKWLFELLISLRGKKNETENSKSTGKDIENVTNTKKPSNTSVSTAPAPISVHKQIDNAKPDMQSHAKKASRWDLQKKINRTKSDIANSIKVDPEKATGTVPTEAIIDILPETDDLFDKELLADNYTAGTGTGTGVASEVKLKSSHKEHKEATNKHNKLTSNSDAQREKGFKNRTREENLTEKASKVSNSKENLLQQSESKASGQNRSITVKTPKYANRSIHPADRELTDQSSHHKVKSKKSKKSSKESSSSRHRIQLNSGVREWDRGKGKSDLVYTNTDSVFTHKKRANHKKKLESEDDTDDEVVSKKRVCSTISSTISSAVKDAYVSDDSSDEAITAGAIVSKVAIPERRSRLPPSKQANRSLLLKAVSEAESSVRKHKMKEKHESSLLEEMPLKHSVRKCLAAVQVVPKRDKQKHLYQPDLSDSANISEGKNIARGDKDQKYYLKKKKLKRKNTDAEHLLTSTGDTRQHDHMASEVKDYYEPATDLNKTRRHIIQEVEEEDLVAGSHQIPTPVQPHMADSRLIVKRRVRESSQATNKNSIIRRSSPQNSFDVRKLSLKDKLETNNNVESSPLRDEKQASSGSTDISPPPETLSNFKSTKQKKRSHSRSPRFIVTLDGSKKQILKANQVKTNLTKDISSPPTAKVPFRPIAITAPTNSSTAKQSSSKPSITLPVQKPVCVSVTSTKQAESEDDKDIGVSDIELSNMRQKLLLMQIEANKFKQIQLKHQRILQQKVEASSVSAITDEKTESRSIHVANVHFAATEKQLSEHFSICGKVLRATVLKDPFTGHPKGFAYLEFEEQKSVDLSLALDGTSFCGRDIKITKKDDDLSKSKLPFAQTRYYNPHGRRFPSRYAGRYNAGLNPTLHSKSRIRHSLPRNRTWVKPGHVPS